MARIALVGVSGYVGGELARRLLTHPTLTLGTVVGRSAVGQRLDELLPQLLGLSDLVVEAFDAEALVQGHDAVVLATPHGATKALVEQLLAALEKTGATVKLIDCSRDHRHAAGWVYGAPEWHRAALTGADRIAVPGCFATAIALALAPLVRAGVIEGPVQIAAATGSTGSGATAKAGTHHPARHINLKAYKVLRHQHVPEISAFLAGLAPSGAAPPLRFVPLSAPVDRGIFATCFARVAPSVDVAALVAEAYADEPLIRVRTGSPELRWVRGSGYCDVAVFREEETAVVLSAIDNLGRGAAAQALQCLNLAFERPLTEGLEAAPLVP